MSLAIHNHERREASLDTSRFVAPTPVQMREQIREACTEHPPQVEPFYPASSPFELEEQSGLSLSTTTFVSECKSLGNWLKDYENVVFVFETSSDFVSIEYETPAYSPTPHFEGGLRMEEIKAQRAIALLQSWIDAPEDSKDREIFENLKREINESRTEQRKIF
jgi:hypothetical protein